MLNIIEKTFGRKILVDVVNVETGRSPLGFETHSPSISFARMPYGKFGVRVKGTEPIDVVVRLDNKVLAQRSLEGGVEHTISRCDDGKPFYFAEPGTKPKFVSEDAGQRTDASAAEHQGMLFPECETEDARYAASEGLVIVQVRFSHVKPDYGPEYAPDDFSNVLFQLNPPAKHAKALAQNAAKVVQSEGLPEGMTEFGGTAMPTSHRQCCVACDRHGH
jgi:hypothetical protein